MQNRYYTYSLEAATIPGVQDRETLVPLNLETALAALHAAHERIREQDAEIAQLRMAVAEVHRTNHALAAELGQAQQLLRTFDPPVGISGVLQQEMQVIQRKFITPDESSHSAQASSSRQFQPGDRVPSPSSLPTPFHSGGASSSSHLQKVEDLPDDVPTLGSLGHSQGQCKPCFYVFSRNGCKFGRSCMYCHLNHARPKKERPPKLVRQECKELANQVFRNTPASADPEGRLMSRHELSRASPVTTKYAASVLRALGRQKAEPMGPEATADGEF